MPYQFKQYDDPRSLKKSEHDGRAYTLMLGEAEVNGEQIEAVHIAMSISPTESRPIIATSDLEAILSKLSLDEFLAWKLSVRYN